jgi:hypothetical protein
VDGEPDPRSREKRQADALAAALSLAATALDAGIPSPTIPRPTTPGSRTAAGTHTGPDGAATGAAAGAAPDAAGTDSGTDSRTDSGTGSGAGSGGSTRGGAGGDVVPGFGAKANITVTIDFEDLKAATADAIGQTVYTDGLSAAAIRRLACDANIIPLVLGSNSEPLDVGRQERLVTKHIRRALNARDRGCVVCGAPPVMCDAHHLIHWIDGGVTAVSNLVLLCRRDHRDLHHGRWTITITNDVVHVARPAWADPPPHPGPSPDTPPPTAPPPDPADVGRSATPDHLQAGRSPADDAGLDDPPERRTARHSVTDPGAAGQDEETVRAATYLAIWGEPLPPDHQPSRGRPKLTPINPWDDTTVTTPAPVAPSPP